MTKPIESKRIRGDQKSPIGKTDYHTMGACFDVLALIEAK
jgi:mannose/cellobiose epimerase-like protein (N-acyl-D-glucosamine 2-epimerase family)